MSTKTTYPCEVCRLCGGDGLYVHPEDVIEVYNLDWLDKPNCKCRKAEVEELWRKQYEERAKRPFILTESGLVNPDGESDLDNIYVRY